MLTLAEVARYLLDCALITPPQIVAGDLAVEDATRRHANYRVSSMAGPAYFVKQGVGPERAAALAHEAAVYEWLTADPAAHALGRYLPHLRRYDAAAGVLVLDLLPTAQPLGAYQSRHGRFSTGLAAQVGVALARLHQIPVGDPALAVCPPPPVLSVPRLDLRLYSGLSQANLQLIITVQQFPTFGARLDALAARWQPTTFIHYDIKGENLLVTPGGNRRSPTLTVVDWEMAGRGDPGWDLGAAFTEYLGTWLASIPITGHDPPDRFLELARYPLARIQPAIRRLWQVYARERCLPAPAARHLLDRAVAYSAARLVQTVFEQNQTAAQPFGTALAALQLAYNILDRPDDAAVQLLGIPATPVAA